MVKPLPDQPSQTSVMEEIARSFKAETNVANPAHVTSYDEATQTVGLQLVQAHAYRDGKAAIARERPPALLNVPVVFPGGADYGMTWPVAVDDPVKALVMDRSISEWVSTGGMATEPQDFRRHDLSDAVAIPGGFSPASPLPDACYDPSALVIYGPQIKLGDSSASAYIALASLVDARFAALAAVFDAWVTVPMDGGAALKAALTALTGSGWPQSVASARVKSL